MYIGTLTLDRSDSEREREYTRLYSTLLYSILHTTFHVMSFHVMSCLACLIAASAVVSDISIHLEERRLALYVCMYVCMYICGILPPAPAPSAYIHVIAFTRPTVQIRYIYIKKPIYMCTLRPPGCCTRGPVQSRLE